MDLTPEAERRLTALLDALADPPSAPDELRVLRAVTGLEQLTTPLACGTTTPARVYEYYNPRQEGRSEQALLVVKDK
jgi:hypothetical protein